MVKSTLVFFVASLIHYVCCQTDSDVADAKVWLESKIPNLDKQMLPKGQLYTDQLKEILSYLLTNKTIDNWSKDDWYHPLEMRGIDAHNFLCTLERSDTVPTSVHKLRPADVKVIGAIGDSLTAGNGIRASWVAGLLVQYRGHAFSVGGVKDLSYHVSLPNILKKGSENLYGYSTGPGPFTGMHAVFNLAVPGSKAMDMPGQARLLVNRIKASKEIDFKNDWKIVTVFVGGNDICDYCKDRKMHSVINYKRHIMEALDILHAELPRTFVNLLEVLDVSLVSELKTGRKMCHLLLQYFLCACASKPLESDANREVLAFQRGYQHAVREIAESGRYDTKEDFTVVSQPFFRNAAPPREENGKYDLSLFGPDCFHLSQIGHSYAGKTLWNNMLQPIGKKSSHWSLDNNFECPTKKRPYFATSKNNF